MQPPFPLPLVNAHTHAAMVAFRGLAEDVPLEKWLKEYIWPAEKEKVSPQFVYQHTKAAIREMRQNGIGLFNDMYFFEDEVARASIEEKMPVVIGEVILDFPTPSAKNPDEALAHTEKLLKKYKNNPYVNVVVAPHAIYSVCRENLVKAKQLADKYGALYHIHVAETRHECQESLKNHGLSPVMYLDKIGVLDEKSILVHCVHLTEKDMDLIAQRKAKIVHCP